MSMTLPDRNPIIVDVEQGSAQWRLARYGVITASNVHRLLTPSGKLSNSDARRAYIGQLVAEYALGADIELDDDFKFRGTKWTERGTDLEPEARDSYQFIRDLEPRKVGFVYRDESRLTGCSPDALVGDEGGWECKAPAPGTHWHTWAMDAVPRKHVPQIQFCLWVTGREWWDFQSYAPGLPDFLLRCLPDPAWQRALDDAIPEALAEIEHGRQRVRDTGIVPAMEGEG